ncbi:MAG TPA: hypothetical protein VLN45_12180 [Ignavibacteriaceae bacterium]|nr:hypothetical protein [Ignavibacteriaceae bacterium]
MKNIFFSLSILMSVLISGCKDLGQGVDIPPNQNKYPANLNMEWEYVTTRIIEYYDTLGNISNTDTTLLGNTIIKVIGINDTLATLSNLIKFESYDISTPENKNYCWYSNSDTGFIAIAYLNPGSTQFVLPKTKEKPYLTFDELSAIINSTEQNLFPLTSKVFSDSVQYYEIPRKVLAYPLSINKRWIELILPFYRERYVDGMVNINFNGQSINCYKVKVDWEYKIELNDFINLNDGLVKREIVADSIMFTSEINPDSGGFGNIIDISNLVRFTR